MSKRKSTSRVKLKAVSQEEQILMCQKHFKNLLGNSPIVTDKSITKINNNQLDIKLGQFTEEELHVVQTKIKSRKAASLNEILTEVWKIRKFEDFFDFPTLSINKILERWTKGFILHRPKKGDLDSLRTRGCPRGVMVKAMDCGIEVREFVLQSRYYVHFRANTFGKGMNPLILPAMG